MTETIVTTTGVGRTRRRVYGGLYSDVPAAERGIRRFRDAGYSGERIGVISRDPEAKDVAEDAGAKAATGAATGAVAGGVLCGIVGLLVGIGALAIPGIGPVVAGGALASAFGLGWRHGRRRCGHRRSRGGYCRSPDGLRLLGGRGALLRGGRAGRSDLSHRA
jgi:hypothetical protein